MFFFSLQIVMAQHVIVKNQSKTRPQLQRAQVLFWVDNHHKLCCSECCCHLRWHSGLQTTLYQVKMSSVSTIIMALQLDWQVGIYFATTNSKFLVNEGTLMRKHATDATCSKCTKGDMISRYNAFPQ